MNSDMSRRTIASSLSNIASATALTSSVLPTPVGPTKMNDAGLCFLQSRPDDGGLPGTGRKPPAPVRSPAYAAAPPDGQLVGPVSLMRCTGMPVHISTTRAISSVLIGVGWLSCSSPLSSFSARSRRERSSACFSLSWTSSGLEDILLSRSSCRASGHRALPALVQLDRVVSARLAFEPASSSRSIALSGRNRSVM